MGGGIGGGDGGAHYLLRTVIKIKSIDINSEFKSVAQKIIDIDSNSC